MAKCYRQLSVEERDRLALLKGQGKSLREIARALNRDPSTISREVKRNSGQIYRNCYLTHRAQLRADLRKELSHERQRLADPLLRSFVRRQIRRGWSPERIAGRWKALGRGKISYEAIYQWLYKQATDLVQYLPRAHRKRLRRHQAYRRGGTHIPSRTPISERPKYIQRRREVGHWEADTIIGCFKKSALQILVERKSRFVVLNNIGVNEAIPMRRGINRSLSRYPRQLRRSITYDNGHENCQHELVNRVLGTKSFFCEPMHSWEKGSVENAVGLVRRRLPKRTDFAMVPASRVKQVERWLNGLPRKCLGFRTAAEAFRRSVALTR